MRVLNVCVGTEVEKDPALPEDHFLLAESFNKAKPYWYLKKKIVNQMSQVNSLKMLGIDLYFGFLSSRRSLKGLFRFGVYLRNMVRKEQIDLVHVQWGSTTALAAVLFSPVPVIISFCGSDLMGTIGPGGRKTFPGIISRCLSQLAALGGRRIIAKSEKLKEVLWPMSSKRCAVIPNGVDLSVFYPMDKDKARAKLGWPARGRIIIFFISGGAPVKDQDLAEETFSIVQDRMQDVHLKLIDDVPHEDLVLYYNAADLMLLTSYHEGSNNSFKEAMSCNLPIVSVDCGDARERLDGVFNSWVEKSRNPYALAQKVSEIFYNGHRSDGRIKVKSISMENVARRIMAVYEEAINSHQGQ